MRYTSNNSGRDRDDYDPDRCDCWYFDTRRKHKGPKVATVMRMATLRGSIPVIVGTLEALGGGEASKRTTVTRMAALRRQKRRQLRGWRPQEALSV